MIIVATPLGTFAVDVLTVTDAELAAMGLTRAWANAQRPAAEQAQEMNDTHVQLLNALAHWDNLTLAQKDAILKHLVRYRLWKEGQLVS